MQIYVRSIFQSQQILKLEEVNALLSRGELDGDEPAWTPGLTEWTTLDCIEGVVIPTPPSFPENSSLVDEQPPPIPDTKQSKLPPPIPNELLEMEMDEPSPQATQESEENSTGSVGVDVTKKRSQGRFFIQLGIVLVVSVGGVLFIGNEQNLSFISLS